MNLRELAGTAVGWLWAPPIAAVAALKRARFFHPEGVCYAAEVRALSEEPLAQAMNGGALVRLSTALWRDGREWPDVLGCAIRFRWKPSDAEQPAPGAQDLLFATARSPLSVWFAPLTTDTHDFLGNDYFAVSPFDAPGLGRVKWRLRPQYGSPNEGRRMQRLVRAVAQRRAIFVLDCSQGVREAWRPFARVVLGEELALDQATLRFSPFRSGLGIVPRGLVHALRHGAYAASQAARPAR